MKAIAFGLLVLLSGCATPEQYRNNLAQNCESVGYQRDTDPWRQCIMQLHNQNQSRAVLGAALIQQQSAPAPLYNIVPYQAPATTNCITSGAYTNCTTR